MFWDKYLELCTKINKSPNAVAKEIGISSGTLTGWKKEKKKPQPMTIRKVAEYFNVPTEYFSEELTAETKVSPTSVAEAEDIMKIYGMLTPERQKQARVAIADLLKDQLQE